MMGLESMWSTKVENEHLGDLWTNWTFYGYRKEWKNSPWESQGKRKKREGEKKDKEEK